LWKSNGTAAGTVLVADIKPGTAASIPASLTVSGGHLFFSADDGVHGTELWDPPISPSPGIDAVQTGEGIRSSGDSPALSALSDGGDAGAGVLSATETPMSRQRQDGMYRLADDPTDIVDQVFAEAAMHSKMARFGLALDLLWNPDLPEDSAFSCQLR
jgi:hypothetical protein